MKKVTFTCIHCKGSFIRYRVKTRPQMFCSRKCYLHSKHHSNNVSSQLTGMKGRRNHGWKGSKVSYKGLHRWIELNYGKAKDHVCTKCNGKKGKSRMNWANLDGKYSRNINTWTTLCKLCHVKHDKKSWGSMTRLYKNKIL